MSSLHLKRFFLLLVLGIATHSVNAHNIDLDGLFTPDQLDKVDWEKAEEITILFEDNNYSPDELTLKKGHPYIFKMINVGDRSHDFVDLNMFHNISVKRISSDFGRINTHHIHSLYLKSGSNLSVYFIPHNTGEFEFFCSIEGHREDGMEGYINIIE